jgi:hypothetical protein
MAKQTIDLGTQGGADGTGDSIRTAGAKINSNFDEIYANSAMSSQISISGNNIKTTQSNADLFLAGSGTGVVAFPNITIDSNINISDNVIKATQSNSSLEAQGSGTGSVVLSKLDMNEGTVDNTVIGGTTPAAATFTTLAGTTLNADGVVITDNTITSTSNADLELSGNGSGTVKVELFSLPSSDGATNSLLRTDGSGTVTFVPSAILFADTIIDDGTDTVTGNSVAQTFDTFSASTYRSAKYTIQISDSTANRFAVVEANVTHDGSNAYISTYGGADNGTGDGSTVYDTLEFTAIISSGEVRVRAKVNNTNSQVLKFVRRAIKV